MKPIRFLKLEGSGNDFILIDTRRNSLPGVPSQWAHRWCDRKRGIGADGLLLVSSSRKGDARMRILNSDGSEASMCGNGVRCVAWYLHSQTQGRRSFDIETQAGLMASRVVGKERVRFYLPPPTKLRLGLKITSQGRHYTLHAIQTGVPHAVLLVPKVRGIDLNRLGPFIRFHRLFQPQGTNVNVAQIHTPHKISIRTYERGVEAETLACGTGALACACIGTALGSLKPPIEVIPPSGERLMVSFRQTRQPWENLYLEGPARILFEGKIP